MPAQPHDRFLSSLVDAGWTVTDHAPVGTGSNPSRVFLRRGRLERRLLVYAWRITSEGKGRKKAGRDDLDYRIQTTRSHETPLMTPAGYFACGIGWDEAREVFGAFDPWVKRYTGYSSSVHFPRALLDAAAESGWSELMSLPKYGPEVAFRPSKINRYLGWAVGLRQRRLLVLDPEEFRRDEERAEVVVDGWREPSATWLRPGDHLIVKRKGQLLDDSVWGIEDVDGDPKETASGRYNRVFLRFRCIRYGVVRNPTWVQEVRA